MDLSGTAQAAPAAVTATVHVFHAVHAVAGQAAAVVAPLADQVMDLTKMTTNQIAATFAAVGMSGVALEQALEKFGLDNAPDKLKPYVPVAVAIGGTMYVAMSKGMPWQQALGLGIGTWVVSQLKHDHAPAATPGATDTSGLIDPAAVAAKIAAAKAASATTIINNNGGGQ